MLIFWTFLALFPFSHWSPPSLSVLLGSLFCWILIPFPEVSLLCGVLSWKRACLKVLRVHRGPDCSWLFSSLYSGSFAHTPKLRGPIAACFSCNSQIGPLSFPMNSFGYFGGSPVLRFFRHYPTDSLYCLLSRLIPWKSMPVADFRQPCLYSEIIGVLYHLVLLYFLDLFSSCSIWFMWGIRDNENHAVMAAISRMPPSAPILTLKKKKIHKQGDGCNSFSCWRTDKETCSPILLLLDERRGGEKRKTPTILVEVPFRKEPAVLFLISFIFSNWILTELDFFIREHEPGPRPLAVR